jgi:NAD-dependent SIR2 family protein deacetylase
LNESGTAGKPGTALQAAIERAAGIVEQAGALVVAAGAGMGVDSGLPDFRGNTGFWEAYPALAQAGVDFMRIASPHAFRTHPKRAWGFYGHRLALYRRTEPHPGFALLRHWGSLLPHGVAVFTSNVDGQFQKAGFDPMLIEECHGSIHHLQCMQPCGNHLWSADAFQPDVDDAACELLNAAPACPQCGALARPNILMFGDLEWCDDRAQAQSSRLNEWLAGASRIVVLELGAGTAIPSVRFFSDSVLIRHRGRLVRINPRESRVASDRDVGLPMGAMEGLQAIAEVLGPGWRL